jgi:hypothetical protein
MWQSGGFVCKWEIRYRTHTMMARRFIYHKAKSGRTETGFYHANASLVLETRVRFARTPPFVNTKPPAKESAQFQDFPGARRQAGMRAKYREKKAALNFKNSSLIFQRAVGWRRVETLEVRAQSFPSQK